MRASLLTMQQQRCPLSARPRQVVAMCHTINRDARPATARSLASSSSFCAGTKLGVLALPARARIAPRRIGHACRTATQGLAEAAAGLGKTLRAFQPTIRELADVSNELKSTLEKEIGLNEVKAELQRPPTASSVATTVAPSDDTAPPSTGAPSSLADPRMVQATDAIAEAVDPEIKQKRAESETAAWGGAPPVATPPVVSPPAVTGPGVAAEAPAGGSLAGMSMEELERELARRKAATPPGDA